MGDTAALSELYARLCHAFLVLHLFECLNNEELVDLSIEDLPKGNEMHFLILNLKLSNSSAF